MSKVQAVESIRIEMLLLRRAKQFKKKSRLRYWLFLSLFILSLAIHLLWNPQNSSFLENHSHEIPASSSEPFVAWDPPDATRNGWWTPFLNPNNHSSLTSSAALQESVRSPWTKPDSYQTSKYGGNLHAWCQKTVASQTKLPYYTGLLYVKSHKSASSTLEGVNIRIARRVGAKKFGDKVVCKHEDRHEFADAKEFGKRRSDGSSLLWSFVRYPPARDMSYALHFGVSRKNRNSTDQVTTATFLQQFINSWKGFQTSYLFPTTTLTRQQLLQLSPHDKHWRIQQSIFQNYDFIGIVERMTESLAVLTLLWDLEPADVIVMSAKRSGGFDAMQQCFPIPTLKQALLNNQPELSQLYHYFQSPSYRKDNPDLYLYHAAEIKLNSTIQALGVDRVHQRTMLIQKLQALVQDQCQNEAIFPCSASGQPQHALAKSNCYVQDAGCGFACIDRVLQEHGYLLR